MPPLLGKEHTASCKAFEKSTPVIEYRESSGL